MVIGAYYRPPAEDNGLFVSMSAVHPSEPWVRAVPEKCGDAARSQHPALLGTVYRRLNVLRQRLHVREPSMTREAGPYLARQYGQVT